MVSHAASGKMAVAERQKCGKKEDKRKYNTALQLEPPQQVGILRLKIG
jgi:hypothetical protein